MQAGSNTPKKVEENNRRDDTASDKPVTLPVAVGSGVQAVAAIIGNGGNNVSNQFKVMTTLTTTANELVDLSTTGSNNTTQYR